MIRISFAVLLLFTSIFTFSRQKIDSLEARLTRYPNEDAGKVRLLNQLGFEYWIVNPVQSIIYGQKSIALASVLQDSSGLAFANRIVGVAHWARGSYDDGLKYLFDGLTIYRQLHDQVGEANCLMNIGLIYSDRMDFDRSLTFYHDAIKLFDQSQAEGRIGTTLSKIATIFIEQKEFQNAEKYLDSALQIHQRNGFLYGQMEAYNRLGLVRFGQGDTKESVRLLNQSLKISSQIEDLEGTAKTYADLANVYVSINELDQAEANFLSGLSVARKIGSHKWLKEIYQGLQVVYRRKGELERAIYYYDKYNLERDSLFNEQTLNNISKLESQLAIAEQQRQIEAKENEIIILQQQTEIQRTRVLLLAVALLLAVGVSFWILRLRQERSRRREQKAKKEAALVNEQLELKNRELASYTVNFVQKNQLFEELIEAIKEAKKMGPSIKNLNTMERTINKHLKVDRDWEDFKLRFENVHKGFFDRLMTYSPNLTNNDLRLSVLIKMNFTIAEIGDMFGISAESVKTARYRLKKKLNLPQEQNLTDFLLEIA